MSYEDLLINECVIWKYTEGIPDPYGNPKKTWNGSDPVPCRLTISSGREIKVGAEVVLSNYRLYLEEVDITERDRVVIDGRTYEVVLVSDRQDFNVHHKECDLIGVK